MQLRSHFTGILLAAGLSTRMGSLKALLNWHNIPLINYQIESLLEAGVRDVVVVLGHEATTITKQIAYPQVTIALNEAYRDGKLTSIQKGIESVPTHSEVAVLLGVDQPRPPETINHLITEHSSQSPLITVPYQGGHRGHPIIIQRDLFSDILKLPKETGNLREILDTNDNRTLRVPFSSDHVHLDLNMPSDYNSTVVSD